MHMYIRDILTMCTQKISFSSLASFLFHSLTPCSSHSLPSPFSQCAQIYILSYMKWDTHSTTNLSTLKKRMGRMRQQTSCKQNKLSAIISASASSNFKRLLKILNLLLFLSSTNCGPHLPTSLLFPIFLSHSFHVLACTFSGRNILCLSFL